MKNAVEGLVLLATSAMGRIRREAETTNLESRITGPISDILISLKGLQDLIIKDTRLYEYLALFIFRVTDKKWLIKTNTLDMSIQDLMSVWGSIYQTIESECLQSLGYLKK